MGSNERTYTSRRMGILNALCEELKKINGAEPFQSDLEGNVEPRLLFWDEVNNFPALNLNAGSETRVYQGGGYKDRFMSLTIRCYVNEEDAVFALEGLLEDVETVLEENSRIAYKDRTGATQYTQQITIVSIDTDEGVLEPLGVGEIICEVRY
jgi:hypothetical protein